jgi:hypothetical protein
MKRKRERIDTMIDFYVWESRKHARLERTMSIEALWAVTFTGVNGVHVDQSAGVIILETNRLFGGDSWQFYTGTYNREETGRYGVRIETGVHNPGGQSIFGGPARAMVLVGEFRVASDQQTATAHLTVEHEPHMKLTATLKHVAPLPS